MLLLESPRPKMALVLLSNSISDPKEATHTEICKLSNDIGLLLLSGSPTWGGLEASPQILSAFISTWHIRDPIYMRASPGVSLLLTRPATP